ncbi:MAG TPA: heat-inducible transcriptional repressor HrcA [Erysipelotrichaceae bacterium]|nr:heat-inducible transcriptional repressor HrcA [Erysipelotrichaceae bacterium]
MLTLRQTEIFRSIVDEFVSTAEPVGSKTLMNKYNINYSSATIRNEMAELESLGLIEKTHTSSGRIPSTMGYRYYVEYLMVEQDSRGYEIAIQSLVDDSYANVEDAIKNASDIISEMTNMTSIVLGPDANEQTLEHIKLFPMDEKSAVAVFITDSGHTENKVFRFSDKVSLDDIESTTEIMNNRLKGTKIKDIVSKMNSIKPILAGVVTNHRVIYNAFLAAFTKFASEKVYFSGEKNMFYQPDFADLEKIKSIMMMMDDPSIWRGISKGEADLFLQTSEKSELAWIDDLAVVSTSLRISGSESAKLMLVGPSRMDYRKIISLIELLSDSLEMIYIEGGSHDEEEE